jgi:non-specific serine/threonine protein kinase
MERFNDREVEILRLIAQGLSNREISERLSLSPETVKWYNRQLFSKLGVTSRARAAAAAERYGLLQAAAPSAYREVAVRKGNLPAQVTSFVGRTREVAEVKQLLRASRLVVLTGAGGTGKTRLALQVAHEVQAHFREGAWLVELAAIIDPDLVPNAIGRVFDLYLPTDASRHDGLKGSLAPKHLLLVLDSFEHLLEAAPFVGELLAVAPALTILATSRQRLNVYGEHDYEVQPLPLPNPEAATSGEDLTHNEAVDLFLQRARAAHPRMAQDPRDLAAAARICIRLDGLPLAIELAASQSKVYPPSILAERLAESLHALPSGPRDVPDRHRTLRATMDWSLRLLSEDEQILFARQSVFHGGGTLDSVQRVCGGGLAGPVAERLASLAEKNLILAGESPTGEMRFAMLETVREYAGDLLKALGESEPLRNQHASHFTQLSEQSGQEFRTSRNRYWMGRLQAENDNLRAALRWSLESGESALAARMATALRDHWHYNGLAAEGLSWTNAALEHSVQRGGVERAGLLATAADLSYIHGNLERARNLHEQSMALYLEADDGFHVAWCKASMSTTYLRSLDEAHHGLQLAQEALDTFRDLEDGPGIAWALNMLGEVTRFQEDFRAAQRAYEECLETVKSTGERVREAISYQNLGIVAYRLGNPDLSLTFIQQGLTVFRELGTPYGLATALGSLAGPLVALGQPRKAAELLAASTIQLELIGAVQQPTDQPEIRSYLELLRRALSADELGSAWQSGLKMTIQAAVSYALSEGDSANSR